MSASPFRRGFADGPGILVDLSLPAEPVKRLPPCCFEPLPLDLLENVRLREAHPDLVDEVSLLGESIVQLLLLCRKLPDELLFLPHGLQESRLVVGAVCEDLLESSPLNFRCRFLLKLGLERGVLTGRESRRQLFADLSRVAEAREQTENESHGTHELEHDRRFLMRAVDGRGLPAASRNPRRDEGEDRSRDSFSLGDRPFWPALHR